MEGSTATEWPPPQAQTQPDISALLQPPIAARRGEKIRTAVLGAAGRRPITPDRAQRTTPSPGVRSAARLSRFRSGLRWLTHAPLRFARPRVKG